MHAPALIRNGRPRGEFRRLLMDALQDAPGTSRELAQRTGIGQRVAMYTLASMVRAGEADSTQRVRRPGVCRPVPFYVLCVDWPTEPATHALAALAAVWTTPRR